MVETNFERQERASFRDFLAYYPKSTLTVLVLALALRVFLAVSFPAPAGDETRYTQPAINLLAGHGFSSAEAEPYTPTEATVPLYPLFVAAVYKTFGQSNLAVRIAQSLLDTLTGLLVAFVSLNLAPLAFRNQAAFFSLVIY